MIIKNILDEDFVNYKKPSMYVAFPYCTFKCEKEAGAKFCQNSPLALAANISIGEEELIERYLNNTITKAIVCCGLEPMESFPELVSLLNKLRCQYHCDDDFVIYTGFNKDEILTKIDVLKQYNNVVIKYGRYKPGQAPHFDEVLGVKLASDNQYAERIS